MGETLLAGFLSADVQPTDVRIVEKNQDRTAHLTDTYGVTCTDLTTAVAGAEIVVLAVKPQDVTSVLEQISTLVSPDVLLISIAAGITTGYLESFLPPSASVVRVMPNTPALLGEGMSVLSAGSNCDVDSLNTVVKLMATVGEVAIVPESDQDAITAISGSGPAYIFYVAEAMVDAGIALGISPTLAHDLVIQTIFGAASMLRDSTDSPEVLRQRVSSPNGVTVRAIESFDNNRVREAFIEALQVARARSEELGK